MLYRTRKNVYDNRFFVQVYTEAKHDDGVYN